MTLCYDRYSGDLIYFCCVTTGHYNITVRCDTVVLQQNTVTAH